MVPRGTVSISGAAFSLSSSVAALPLLLLLNHCMTLLALTVEAGTPNRSAVDGGARISARERSPRDGVAGGPMSALADLGGTAGAAGGFSETGVSPVTTLRPGRALKLRLIGSTMTVSVFLLLFLLAPSGLNIEVVLVSAAVGETGETGTCRVEGRLLTSPLLIVSVDEVRPGPFFLFCDGARATEPLDCSPELNSFVMPILSIDKPRR